MHYDIYARWSAGIILIGNFDLRTQHHWSLMGTQLSYMDGALWIQELQYYGIIFQTTLNVHRPYIYLKSFWKHFSFFLIFTYFTLCSMYVLSKFSLYVFLKNTYLLFLLVSVMI